MHSKAWEKHLVNAEGILWPGRRSLHVSTAPISPCNFHHECSLFQLFLLPVTFILKCSTELGQGQRDLCVLIYSCSICWQHFYQLCIGTKRGHVGFTQSHRASGFLLKCLLINNNTIYSFVVRLKLNLFVPL